MFAAFGLVSLLVIVGATRDIDQRVLEAIGPLRTPVMTSVMVQLSNFGNWHWEVPLALGIVATLLVRGHPKSAWRYLAICLSGEAVYALIKFAFHRPRPTIIPHLSQAGWYSYPSGHSTLAPIVWGLGLALVAQMLDAHLTNLALWTLAFVVSGAIALSRIYLGVHYPSDVLGGLCLGIAWVLLWRDRVPLSRKSPTSSAASTK
jgi:undecaprenyl-diphosphatase